MKETICGCGRRDPEPLSVIAMNSQAPKTEGKGKLAWFLDTRESGWSGGLLEDCAELQKDVSHVPVVCCRCFTPCRQCNTTELSQSLDSSLDSVCFVFQGALCHLQQGARGCQSGLAIAQCNKNLEQAGLIKILYLGDTIQLTKPGLFIRKGCMRGFLLGVWGVCSQWMLA